MKMVYFGKNIKLCIVFKGISVGKVQNIYCGLVLMYFKVKDSCNYIQCDSLLIGLECGVYIVFYIEVKNNLFCVEYEVIILKVDDDQLFYCCQCGMDEEEVVVLVVNGFCKEVFQVLLMEFVMEVQQLVVILFEGLVG